MIKRWKKLNLTVQIMIGLAIGVILGFIIPKSWTGVIKASQTIGTIYMNALKMMIYPLVFCSLVCGIRSCLWLWYFCSSDIGDWKKCKIPA